MHEIPTGKLPSSPFTAIFTALLLTPIRNFQNLACTFFQYLERLETWGFRQ